ncbi:2-phosphosulfolactate phosphatase [Nocardioides terrisoli]|uniref:2-phosphosulfolactate phosphatase n=1 Tax=Nocardioides terrisoli TaxID=3388267 RepID=UPI00287BC3F5|nr:2-phosphosulfolactate phosphatase [Nocardioides marmorisolisilvae]
MDIPRAHRQDLAPIRFGWGLAAANALARDVDVAVVVDVLSFTTTTTVALDAGATVIPLRWRDERAEAVAREAGAVLAVGRSTAHDGQVSLSPAGMRRHARAGQTIALPSPNGATIARALTDRAATCVAGCLRNAPAVGRWIHEIGAERVVVVAAGERWPDDTLRPADEDLWGAGAVLAALHDLGHRAQSVEADTARASYLALGSPEWVRAALHRCASGRELADSGFKADVDVAAEVGASTAVPVLRRDRFEPATVVP